MSRRPSANRDSKRVTPAGGVTDADCPVRGANRPCLPLNRVTTWTAKGTVKDHCTCSCGRRYPVGHDDAPEHLVGPRPPAPGEEPGPGAGETWRIDQVWPLDREDQRAAVGVVPVGTAVLHRPTQPVGRVTGDVRSLAKHMVKVMARAPGVGLAANQVGAPLRLFVQVHRRAAPEAMVDPEVRATEGVWTFPEGCLSLQVEATQSELVRPRRIQIRAHTLHGDVVELTADEIVARICQHEIDHLDGIEYVQRLTGDEAERVYSNLRADGVDVAWVPPAPY
jgi:peptide deformylase